MNFNSFKIAVASQFNKMQKSGLFVTQVPKDVMWDTYLKSFPAGTDPILNTRTEHDCNCCKQFIRTVGNTVAIIDNKMVSIWDVKVDDEYQVVANAMSKLVKAYKIDTIFRHFEKSAGTDKNFSQLVDGIKTWEHFHVNIHADYVASSAKIPTILGDIKTSHGVAVRGLNEISMDAIDTVLELVTQNSIYRGQEFKSTVSKFKELKAKYDSRLNEFYKDIFVWSIIRDINVGISHIRNSVIGTLLVDISNGVELDVAVKSYESKVAPTNYKRPSAVVTHAMITKAKEKIEELGLTSALERRYANIDDISINNLLFADRSITKKLNATVFDELESESKKKPKKSGAVTEVSIEQFIADILPTAKSVELQIANNQVGNMVSLITSVDPTANKLFKWNNQFSWSYDGEVADSIKERVKNAGGNVTGDLCCRLAWYNYDDLDLFMIEPTGRRISFMNKGQMSGCGGFLDVDMNAGRGTTTTPVENIVYQHKDKMQEGFYSLNVNQYSSRNANDIGFDVDIEFMGEKFSFAHKEKMKSGATVEVARIKYSKANGIEFINTISKAAASVASKDVWGIKTNEYVKVNSVMMSPNFWDDNGIGNKHYFFMLDGCKNPTVARGFYNEFLSESMTPHRKVLEMVGNKMKTDMSDKQLSGIGFSSTKKDSVLVKVTGSFTRVIKINF